MTRKAIVLFAAFVLASGSPSGPVYDQRQEGNTNVHAQLENVVVLLVPPQGMGLLDLVALASKSVGSGKHDDVTDTSYRHSEIVDSHRTTTHHDLTTPLDDKLQRDPNYEQVQTLFQNIPAIPYVAVEDSPSATTVQDPTTSPPTTLATSSAASKFSSLDDVITAHSPKLALYSQFRSVSHPSNHKKPHQTS